MRILLGKSPFLRSLREEPDDLFVMANSFQPRCLYAISTAPQSRYGCKRAIVVNYESKNETHRKIKEIHLARILKNLRSALLGSDAKPQVVNTHKYDVMSFYSDLDAHLGFDPCSTITVDISTFTKCTLAVLLSMLHDRFPRSRIRCVWTPSVHSSAVDLTKGVSETFAVPGFGGIGWRRCRVLVLFMGQEHDRTYSLWRAVDPDLVYLVASRSEYSAVRPKDLIEEARDITAFVESRVYRVSAVDPQENQQVLDSITEDLEKRDYKGEVAVACLGTKLQLIGIWNFWQENKANKKGWSYVYASPKDYARDVQDYYRELNEVDLTPEEICE